MFTLRNYIFARLVKQFPRELNNCVTAWADPNIEI